MEMNLPTPMTARVYVNLPEGSCWGLWFTMIHYDSLWFTMIHYDSLWFTMIHYGVGVPYHSLPVYDSLWFTMIHYDSLWFTMIHYDSLWFTMIHYGVGVPYHSLPVYDSLWFTMIHYDSLWFTMIHYDSLCLGFKQQFLVTMSLWFTGVYVKKGSAWSEGLFSQLLLASSITKLI